MKLIDDVRHFVFWERGLTLYPVVYCLSSPLHSAGVAMPPASPVTDSSRKGSATSLAPATPRRTVVDSTPSASTQRRRSHSLCVTGFTRHGREYDFYDLYEYQFTSIRPVAFRS